jgi:hypothetical protein
MGVCLPGVQQEGCQAGRVGSVINQGEKNETDRTVRKMEEIVYQV